MTFEDADAPLREELEAVVGMSWDDWKVQGGIFEEYKSHFHKNLHVGPHSARTTMRALWSSRGLHSQADIPAELEEVQFIAEDTMKYNRNGEAITVRTLRGYLRHALDEAELNTPPASLDTECIVVTRFVMFRDTLGLGLVFLRP